MDLESIPDDYFIRTKYKIACPVDEYTRRVLKTSWGTSFHKEYRLVNREYVGCTSERTLQGAILPPDLAWVNTIFGWCVPTPDVARVNTEVPTGLHLLALMDGCYASLPYDYYVRANGKGHVNYATTISFPVLSGNLTPEIIARAMLLNCVTKHYADLWGRTWDESYHLMTWTKEDHRLSPDVFAKSSKTWDWATPLRSDYSRRQALVELDVLVSMSLGLTLDQLKYVYRLDFSVLQSYEDDTWYDANGRIVFSKKTMGAITLDRSTFEGIKSMATGVYNNTITDDTQPGGPVERTIEYVAPFDRCDREQDYEIAWAFFEEKYKG
jgi:hypothetical protein